MTLVYQHYAPKNLASFIQRKGRGGRGVDDRPVTGVTLSPYSPRDSWYYRRPHQMLDSSHFEVPLNVGNYFVRRGQVLATLLDALAQHRSTVGVSGLVSRGGRLIVGEQALGEADRLVRSIFGDGIYRELGYLDLVDLWQKAADQVSTPLGPETPIRELRVALPWIPQTLFATVNLPALAVRFQSESGAKRCQTEGIDLAFEAATPGHMTRRYGFSLLHWIPPQNGKAPWLSNEVYRAATGFTIRPLEEGPEALLRELPEEARAEVGTEIHPNICLPGAVNLEVACKVLGATPTPLWYFESDGRSVQRIGTPEPAQGLKAHPKSRGSLRSFNHVEAAAGAGRSLAIRGIEHIASRLEAYFGGGGSQGEETGLSVTSLTWGADAELRLMDPTQPDIPFTQTFVHPRSGKTLLHGYRVETEGIRLHLDSGRLTEFVHSELARLRDHPDGRWHRAQMFRYLVGTEARAAGINAYEANRAADLLFSAAGHPELRERLRGILKRWDSQALKELLLQTYSEMLAQHPLLSERRVERLAEVLGDRKFQRVSSGAFARVRSDDQFAVYLRSVLIHGIAIRLKQAFVLHGRGDERQVLVHAKLPIQFGADVEDVVTVAENGGNGDGTTRMFVENLPQILEEWSTGALAECPNAREDALIAKAFACADRHGHWRSMDPRNAQQMTELAQDLEVDPELDEGALQGVLRLPYGSETVGRDRVDFYDLHKEILAMETQIRQMLAREPAQWELVSAVVRSAADSQDATPSLAATLRGYQALEDAALEESLDAEARLADQVYRISARLCVDGCQGCLHTGSDLMADTLAESVVGRRLLERFVAGAV